MAFSRDLYDGYALVKIGGSSFDILAAVGTREPARNVVEALPAEPNVGHPAWFGSFSLTHAEARADFDAAVALAATSQHDVVLQLPSGEQARIAIEGEWFTGLDEWPLD